VPGSELWEQPVSYAAVGATQAADLLQYPPVGFRPIVKRVRIGHGPLRWSFASQAVLSWGVQRRSGLRVETVESPPETPSGCTFLLGRSRSRLPRGWCT
jgi:uncharacterized protein (UPF0548 family)